MSCYRPLLGTWLDEYSEKSGKRQMKFIGVPYSYELAHTPDHYKDFPIPCGSCSGCLLDRSREWADRMTLELDHSKVGIFVTLTYNDDHVPFALDDDGFPIAHTLCKRDVQLFMKRLRKFFTGREIRFYLAGEYGPETWRPHYHAIIFGLSLEDFSDLRVLGVNELKQPYYTSPTLEKIWRNGFVSFSHVTWQTCAYVARYVDKKRGTRRDLSCYNMVNEFALMSRDPGIGNYYIEDHPDMFDDDCIIVSDPNGCKRIYPGRSYLEKLQLINPELYDSIKEKRKAFADDRLLLELKRTDLNSMEYYAIKERNSDLIMRMLERSNL